MARPLRSWTSMQFGLSYISSILKADGHETKLVVLGSNTRSSHNERILNTHMDEFSPDLVGFTAVASQYPFIEQIAGILKCRWPDKYLVIGGVHATLNPSEVIRGSFDAVCIGEGEYPMLELCRQLESGAVPHGIANLWIKSRDGRIERNAPRPFFQDVDSLPFPDRAIWTPWVNEQLGAEVAVLLGRGCPYGCTYCCNHALKKVASGKYVRFRSPGNIIDEVAFLHATHPTQSKVYFEVESIALNKDWLIEFCNQLEVLNDTIDRSISYGCNFRISPQAMDEEIFFALRRANFTRINIGLESGSERIRREVLKRDYSNKDFLNVTIMARKVGLKISVFNMIGLPEETFSDHMETVSLNRQCQPDNHYTGIFFPYPGTELYDLCIRKNLIVLPIDNRLERSQPVIELPLFTRSQIRRAYTLFNYRIYKGFRPFWWILMQTVMTKIRGSVAIYSLFRRVVQWPGMNLLRERLART